jgi:hypothetical protein
MSARTKRHAAEKTKVAAQLCKVPLTEWAAMTRRERRSRLWAARWEATR